MRKLAICAVALAAVCLVGACTEKEGQYTPKKQISNVYQSRISKTEWMDEDSHTWLSMEGDTLAKTLSEKWEWDGKQLKSITFYDLDDHSVTGTATFTYDGKQMTRADMGESGYATFTYDASTLTQFDFYEKPTDTKPYMTYTFTREGGKITAINMSGEGLGDMRKANTPIARLANVLRSELLPTLSLPEKAEAAIRTASTKGENSFSMNLKWDGDNVSNVSIDMGFISVTIDFTYDNKNNPYAGFLFTMVGYGDGSDMGIGFANKNNPIHMKMVTSYSFSFGEQTFEETETDDFDITYTYDGKWPTSRTSNSVSEYEDMRYTSAETYYFEYAK